MRLLRDRRGDMLAYFAVLMVFVAVPLSSLSIDIVRGMYVRGHLHTATDAACQAAADALDVPLFTSTGQRRINPGLARAQAAAVFSATLRDSGATGFSPSLAIGFPGPTTARCASSASVERLLPGTPNMEAVVETTSEMRVRTLR